MGRQAVANAFVSLKVTAAGQGGAGGAAGDMGAA